MSEHEQKPKEGEQEQSVQDLEVSEEQAEDVTGGVLGPNDGDILDQNN